MTHTVITRSLWICAALLAGCSPQPDKKPVETEMVEPAAGMNPADGVEKSRVVNAIMPPEDGVFLVQNGALQLIQAGDENRLMPTNAERGFGFAVPEGTVVQGGERFAIQTRALNLSQIQVTSYRGIAVNTGAWFDDVDDSNVAWIPGAVMSASVEVIDEQMGIVNLGFSKPLSPGFYVLHDETMVSARQKSDVSAYYPFIVQGNGQISPWAENAELCFERIYEKYGESVKLEDPEKLDVKELKKCAYAQRLARKMAKGQGASDEDPFLRTLYLSRILTSSDPAAHRLILDSMNSSGNRLEQILWKIENQDQIWRLVELKKQIDDESVAASTVSFVLDFYASGLRHSAGAAGEAGAVPDAKSAAGGDADEPRVVENEAAAVNEDPSPAGEVAGIRPDAVKPEPVAARQKNIALMSWMPFFRLDAGDSELGQLMHQMTDAEKKWDGSLVAILGALQVRDIQNVVRRNRALAGWYKKFESKIPADVRQRAGKLQLRSVENTVSFGPYIFEGIPEREMSSWKATVASVENDVSACFGKEYRGESAVFILEQPLNGAPQGRDSQGVLRDPVDTQRSRPAIDPRTVECVLNAYGQMPLSPALSTTQRVKVAVTVVNAERAGKGE